MTVDLLQAKTELRRRMRERRDALLPGERSDAGSRIADGVEGWLAQAGHPVGSGTRVGLYLPIGSEADPRPAGERLAARGAVLAAPAIVGDELVFRRLDGARRFEPQGFGTVAPGEDAESVEPDILLVPLLAFDGEGRRIGYGRGFFDRAIARLRARGAGLVTVGIAFDTQRVERVPTQAHDAPLDVVVTESGAVRPSAAPPSR